MSQIAIEPPGSVIVLPPPSLPSQATLEMSLKARRSCREYLHEPLSPSALSALLWAAFGINRPASGGRTAPSARNWQDIDVYALLREGAYRYDARAHLLLRVRPDDLRGLSGTQDFVAEAPLNLVYVADFGRMDGTRAQERTFFAGAHAGFIAQNVYLFCAGSGLGTVVRALIERGPLAAALGLPPTQRIALAQTVGHPAAARP